MASDGNISAVVVTYRTGPVLNRCIQALLDDPVCREVILVDNGNDDSVLVQLAAWARDEPRLTLITGHGNIGFGRGCNLGAHRAKFGLIAFVNPDCEVDLGTLARMATAAETGTLVLVGGCILGEDGHEQRGARRGHVTLWSAMVSFSGLGRPGEQAGLWRDVNRLREPLPSMPVEMPVITGALMVTSAAAFQRIGGFDERFFLHVEDIDLCKRYWLAGGKVIFVPEARAIHIGSTSQVASWRVEIAKIHSFLRYFWKHARSPVGHFMVILIAPLLILGFFVRFAFQK